MNLSDTDQAPYSAPAPQTAKVSDEAVQAALDKCEKVDWVQGLFGTGLSGREIIESALTAALPHLALSAAPCSVEVEKLPCDVQLPGAIFKRGVSISTLITALERREYWPDVLTHLPAKPVDVAAVRRQAFEEAAKIADNGMLVPPDGGSPTCEEIEVALRIAAAIRALSPAEPVDQWQDIATAPKDGEPILIWKPDEHRVGEYLMSAYWCDDREGFVPVGGIHKQGYYSDTAQCNQGYPTHWMPLPAAPTSKGGE